MADERYVLFGFVPSDHPDLNQDLNPDHQKVQKAVPVYSTNDQKDAEYIIKEGGFIKNDQWFAVVGGKDTETGVQIGNF